MTTLDTRPNGTDVDETLSAARAAEPASPLGEDVAPPRRARRWIRTAGLSTGDTTDATASQGVEDQDEALRMLALVRRSRRYAVALTAAIATVSFVLSFASLKDLAAMSAWPGWPAWLWPLIIDGTIVLATLGIVALAPYREQRWNRVYFWLVLMAAAGVSVGGNALHAWLATADLVLWMRYGSAAFACVPPIALLASTHSLAILWRFNPTPPPDTTSEVRDRALALAVERMDRWEAAAAKMQEEGYCPNVATSKIAHALRYLYDCRPAMSLRAIGEQPEVDLHHDTVSKIRGAATAVLGVAAGGDR